MLNLIAVTLTFLIIGGLQLYSLFKKHLIKEALVNIVFLIIALIYAYEEILLWRLPGPTDPISLLFSPLAKLIFDVSLE